MAVPNQQLKIRTGDSFCGNRGGYGGVLGDALAKRTGGAKVVVDVLGACFVEGKVGLAEREEVKNQGL